MLQISFIFPFIPLIPNKGGYYSHSSFHVSPNIRERIDGRSIHPLSHPSFLLCPSFFIPNRVKVNFDASIKDGNAALGYVIRNHEAKPIQAGRKLLFAYSVPFVELLAAWMGVKAAVMELIASHVWLEGDSISVINWIKKSYSKQHFQVPVFHDLWLWKSTLVSCTISYIYHKANQVADYLAARAVLCMGSLHGLHRSVFMLTIFFLFRRMVIEFSFFAKLKFCLILQECFFDCPISSVLEGICYDLEGILCVFDALLIHSLACFITWRILLMIWRVIRMYLLHYDMDGIGFLVPLLDVLIYADESVAASTAYYVNLFYN